MQGDNNNDDDNENDDEPSTTEDERNLGNNQLNDRFVLCCLLPAYAQTKTMKEKQKNKINKKRHCVATVMNERSQNFWWYFLLFHHEPVVLHAFNKQRKLLGGYRYQRWYISPGWQ